MTLRGNARRQVEDLAWCPDEFRAEYFRIAGDRQFKAEEAKRIMLDHIAAVHRRRAQIKEA